MRLDLTLCVPTVLSYRHLMSRFCNIGAKKRTPIGVRFFCVDATGFEPAASASRTQRSTKLSHASLFYLRLPLSKLHYLNTGPFELQVFFDRIRKKEQKKPLQSQIFRTISVISLLKSPATRSAVSYTSSCVSGALFIPAARFVMQEIPHT